MVEVDLSKGYWKLGVATYSSEIFHRLALNLKKTPTLSPGQTIATLLGATCCDMLRFNEIFLPPHLTFQLNKAVHAVKQTGR